MVKKVSSNRYVFFIAGLFYLEIQFYGELYKGDLLENYFAFKTILPFFLPIEISGIPFGFREVVQFSDTL